MSDEQDSQKTKQEHLLQTQGDAANMQVNRAPGRGDQGSPPDDHQGESSADTETASVVDWYDAVLNANHWFSLPEIDPQEAAMLLCRQNPHDQDDGAWPGVTTDETTPTDHAQLLRWCESVGGQRSLIDWYKMAKKVKANRIHAWIEAYVEKNPKVKRRPQGVGATQQVRGFAKEALIREYGSHWPDIKSDLSHASRNGLAQAAKSGARGWDAEKALEWAKSQGKLKGSQHTKSAPASPLPTLESLPKKVHRMEG